MYNIFNFDILFSLGLDIGTLIEVRRAQLAYKLSDEVLFFFLAILLLHLVLHLNINTWGNYLAKHAWLLRVVYWRLDKLLYFVCGHKSQYARIRNVVSI